ncbi:mucin-4-like [Gastrophryne carolinensis]
MGVSMRSSFGYDFRFNQIQEDDQWHGSADKAGFTGPTCNVDIDECLSNPCRNGATCNDLINSFTCQCAAGFTGRFCEMDVDECKNGQSRCSSNAICTNKPGSYTCNCKAGYYGDGFTCKENRLLEYKNGNKVTQRFWDFASPLINIPTGFPFGGSFYSTLYFTDNGVIMFRRNSYDPIYTIGHPYYFSNNDYSTPPMIAVFWADADFSRMGDLWYKIYDFQAFPNQYQDVKSTLESYVKEYFTSLPTKDFQALWAIMITWENVLPYPAYYFSSSETNTYQAVLVTDGIYSFCFMTYQDGGMNWRYDSLPTYYSPKMGYFSGEPSSSGHSPYFPAFNDPQTSPLASIPKRYTPDQYVGTSTNRLGYWAYRLEYNTEWTVNAKQQCLNWYYKDLYTYPAWIYYSRPCPCSYGQAVFDSSYTPASSLQGYGIQQKNTDYFSPSYTFQSAFSSWYGGGTRCYYNYMGSLSFGEKERFLPTPWEYENSWLRWQNPSFYYYYYYPYYLSQLEQIRKEYKELEVDPYNNCCRYSGSSYYCSLYRQRRPYDYCFGYVPPSIGVLFGDPHINTLDGVQYTFNGLGEFILANVRNENDTVTFILQGRTDKAGNGTQATNFVGLAALIQNQTTVEWLLQDSNITLVRINGTEFPLPDNSTYVDKVTLEKTEKNEVLASFDGGISVTVSAQLGALNFVTSLDTSYKNKTEGLLGVFNDDKTDDLMAANGTKLEFDGIKLPNESLIFEIGMTWKTTPLNTIFIYNKTNKESWYTYNNNSFVPLFYDELLRTSDPDLIQTANQTCGGNNECIFDILSTRNFAVGEATLGSVIAAQEQSSTMNNFPPNVTGPTTLTTKIYEPVTVNYTATDENNDIVIFSLLSDSSDINITVDGVLVWLPTSSAPINATITADDSKVITEVALTLVLCNCTNNGSCLYDSPVSLSNGTNNFMVARCNCSAAWTGMYCEEDFNACAENKCYNTSTCVDMVAPEEGFTCGPCPDNLEGDGISCRAIKANVAFEPGYWFFTGNLCEEGNGNIKNTAYGATLGSGP